MNRNILWITDFTSNHDTYLSLFNSNEIDICFVNSACLTYFVEGMRFDDNKLGFDFIIIGPVKFLDSGLLDNEILRIGIVREIDCKTEINVPCLALSSRLTSHYYRDYLDGENINFLSW